MNASTPEDSKPWPVRFMYAESAELFDQAVEKEGLSLETVMTVVFRTWSREAFLTQSLGYALGCWHVYGRQSFRVSPLLTEALRETSLEKVPSEAFRSPYPAIWVEAPLVLTDRLPPFFGFFLIERTFDQGVVLIRNAATSARGALDAVKEPYPPGTRFVQAIAVGPEQNIFATDLYLVRENLEESIEETLATIRRRRAAAGQPVEERGQDQLALRLWAFASSFALYLSSPDPDLQVVQPSGIMKPPKSAKAREIQERIRRREGEVRLLGYRLTRVLHRPAVPAAEHRTAGGGGRLVQPHLVRGHFKRQVHGPGRAERKWIWIAPYRRGDDGSEERIERTYAVE